MDLSSVVAHLEAVGIEADQARLYVHLLHNGPSKASTMASISGSSRTKVYRDLDKLVDRGLVEASLESPTVYRALGPTQLFEGLLADRRRSVAEVERARERLMEPLETLAAEEAQGSRPFWQVVEGRLEILDRLGDLLDHAEREVRVLSTHALTFRADPPMTSLWDRIRERAEAEDGFTFRAVLHVPDRARERMAALARVPGIDIRHTDEARMGHFIVFDQEETVAWLVADPSERLHVEGDAAVYTNADAFVSTKMFLFDALWERATPLVAKEDEADREDVPPEQPQRLHHGEAGDGDGDGDGAGRAGRSGAHRVVEGGP